SREHHFYFHGLVLYPARRVAPSHVVHDHSADLICLLSDWLHHLSCARWGEILRIHRLARGDLLPYAGFARSAGVCDLAASDFDAHAGFSPPMGPARADSALDGADLALRLGYRGACLFDAV